MRLSTVSQAASELGLSDVQLSLLSARQWVNTQPLTAADIRGKVTLVNFWTYSCINSLRPLPYVRAWAEKYRDRGLLVVGAHTPEFAFEKDIANVKRATGSLGVTYPVPLDSDYAIWRAFHNEAWPAFYFVGADGRVRGRMLGEGDYDQSERLIQKLLTEADGSLVIDDIVAITGKGVEAPADEADLRSPETYAGFAKADHFASPGGMGEDEARLYQTAPVLALNRWSLAGIWTIGSEFATLDEASGRITFRFHARDLHLVMGIGFARANPLLASTSRSDGAPPGDSHGIDTNADGLGNGAGAADVSVDPANRADS